MLQLRTLMTAKPLFQKLAIFGVGLIGGSVALAMRRAGQTGTIVGVGRDPKALDEALALGVIDQADSAVSAVQDADLILLATPVGQFESILHTISPYLGKNTLITDAGSTKGNVVAVAKNTLNAEHVRFIPAHPIAGAEKSGVTAAKHDLFIGKNVVLTPFSSTSTEDVTRIEKFWQECGAQTPLMTPEQHDRIFAAVSHLPHLLAFALVDDIARRENASEILGYAAGGFRDFSRIAGSSPEMWRDISLANREALLDELDAYQTELNQLRNLIQQEDGNGLEMLFQNASQARNTWIKQYEK